MGEQGTRNKLGILVLLYRDPDRKSIFRMVFEALNLLFIYKELPVHYFSRLLFKKRIRNYKDYLPNGLSSNISVLLNNQNEKEVLDNKLSFDRFYRKLGLPMPALLMYNERKNFIRDGKTIEIDSLTGFIGLLRDIFRDYPEFGSIMIKKAVGSSSGKNIFRVPAEIVFREDETLHGIYTAVVDSEFVFQETVSQHPDLDRLNSSCLNTMRLDTFLDKEGKAEIISGYIRTCLKDVYVDNISAGGCMIGIDILSGRLKKYAYSTISVLGIKELTRHPVTGTVFENFSIPYFPEACDLVRRAAVLKKSMRLVGWDVAISRTGPILIEGNSDYVIAGNDVAYGGYMSNPVFRKVLQEINYL